MNSTKVTTRKGSKTKTKKESPEVFVLPPNLLEKLGINLGTYGSATGSTANSKVTDINVIFKENGPCENIISSKNDSDLHVSASALSSSSEIELSSIIETAELMKKSVFLSPTFIANNTSVIQGEIEIVGSIASENIEGSTRLVNDEYNVINHNEANIDLQRDYASISNSQKSVSSLISSSTQKNKECDQIDDANVELQDLGIQTFIDDHADEAYSSDCSSNNTACGVKPDLSKCSGNKINIITDEIIYPSQFYNSKNNLQECTLIHLPANNMTKNHIINSVQQDSSNIDFIPNVTGNIGRAVNECDKCEHNFVRENKYSKDDMDILQDTNKINERSGLNVNEIEFITETHNYTDTSHEFEALQIAHKQELTVVNKVTTDATIAVPCQIDYVDKNQTEKFISDRNIELDDIEHIDGNSSTDEKYSDSISTKPISNKCKPDMVGDKKYNSSCIVVAENKINSLGERYCQKKACLPSINTTGTGYSQKPIVSKKVSKSPENNNIEPLGTLQNREAYLTNCDKNIHVKDDEQVSIIKTVSENVIETRRRRHSESISQNSDVNKSNSQRDTSQVSQCKQGTNNGVHETSMGKGIVYFKQQKQVCENQETQKHIHEKKEPHKSYDNGSPETTDVRLHCVNNTAIHDDKVKEIAKYLSAFADLKKRNHFIKGNKSINSVTLNKKKHIASTKSTIQGVEKPGGSEINKNHTIKTYGHTGTKQGWKTVPSYTFEVPNSTQSIDLTNSSTSNIRDEMEICLCHDFGKLVSYDDVNTYQHIHFWNNPRTDCTPDVIFSIYSEDSSHEAIDNSINSNIKDYPSEDSDLTLYKMCWNEINHMSENVLDDQETEKNVLSEQHILRKNDDTEIQEAKKENMVDNTMITENTTQNCETILNKQTALDEPCAKTGVKRKLPTVLADNDEPSAKNKKQGTAKQLLGITEKKLSVKNSPLKDTCLPVNETTIERHSLPSTSINEAEFIEERPKSQLPTESENKLNDTICGVCQISVEGDWIKHIAAKHDYMAWKSGEPTLDLEDKDAVREHLNQIANLSGGLSCGKCGLTRKYVKAYLSHVRRCSGVRADRASEVTSGEESVQPSVRGDDLVTCAVCEEVVQETAWNEHRAVRHDYLAWKTGQTPLDVRNETAVKEHLYEITKACGGLTCAKCGLTRKYVKAYMSHVRSCTGLSDSQNDSAYNLTTEIISKEESDSDSENIDKAIADTNSGPVKCGVCDESVEAEEWDHHIGSRHDYLAWKHGNTPLDVNDEEAVRSHLYDITKTRGGLTCAKCGLTRKYVKAYLSHIKSCHGLNESQNDSTYDVTSDDPKVTDEPSDTRIKTEKELTNIPLIKCAVCEESLQEQHWDNHIASQHDYLAWKVGDTPLDINDEAAVKDHLYAITNSCGGLTCSKCGLTRKYVKSYLTHFKNCDPTNVQIVQESQTPNEKHKAVVPQVKCAICLEDIPESEWYTHIGSKHNYLAWQDGEESLDINNEESIRHHLVRVKKDIGCLKCAKCCKRLKTVKKYMSHIKSCDGTLSINDLSNSSLNLVLDGQVEAPCTTSDPTLVKCGVCGQYTSNDNWMQHVATVHGYLAWKDGDTSLNVNDEEEVREHLQNIIVKVGSLSCPKCNLARKSVKSYLRHLETCDEEDKRNEIIPTPPTIKEHAHSFKCGVCSEMVISLRWAQHLSEKHDYLAWKDGETPVNVDNEEEVYHHLFNYTKQFGLLHCRYCGKDRKYAKSFLEHIKFCKNGDVRVIDRASVGAVDFDESVVDFASGGTCAVCHKEIDAGKWIQHTQKQHNYLAWREGEKPWDVDDFEDVNQYLYVICKRMDGLTCNKCGLVRKYVKSYMTHIKKCEVADIEFDPVADGIGPANKDEYQCAMCRELIKSKNWKTHAMEKHYNITWIVGETPIDIKNVYAVERFLKEYKHAMGILKCNACGLTRASYAGFYAHIIICKKTEEEIDMYRSICNICNNKYLCIYKNQHAMIHKVQMLTAELKSKQADEKDNVVSGKRRAAVKARTVIENYSDNMSKHQHSCKSCGFGTDYKEELKKHKCEVSTEKDFSADEESAAEIGSSDDESGDTDVDSNISNEVQDEVDDDEEDDVFLTKKKRHRESAAVSKVTRIPFEVEDVNTYIRQGDVDYCNTYLTDEVLFPQWRCQHEAVPESDLTRYLPPLEHSCKLKFGSDWTTLKKFESKRNKYGTSIFVGASIVCVAWVPPRVQDMADGIPNYLAVACHNGPDCPRYQGAETPKHENLIQIWDFNNFEKLPELVLGIAHDFGTVWSMDWCPSGARDALDGDKETRRLGLLAVACSSGSVYIFAVPHPSTLTKNKQIVQKLRPVAELRMSMGTERKSYQATSVSWSKQKEHKLVLVGYADGSTAYYDLHTDSPLLSTVENNVQVFHPYYDERSHNTCITGTDLYPVSGDAAGSGCGAWTSPTGAELAPRAGTGVSGRARMPTASLGVTFAPQACTAVLTGDDAIMQASVSELAWAPQGRRAGGARGAAGCARCGRAATFSPPALRVMRLHPSYCDPKKQVIGILEMTHLAKKRKKKNDELCMIVEPLTYDDAVGQYGIEFTRIGRTDRVMQQQYAAKPKTHCPERFPLADVQSMAFCPSKRFHEKLALATHSGIMFLITTN